MAPSSPRRARGAGDLRDRPPVPGAGDGARGHGARRARGGRFAGGSSAFALALLGVLAWLAIGPVVGWSERWLLAANTVTTVVTFLMVFLLQRSQSKESRAIELKLNEIVAALEGASNRLIGAERLSEADLASLEARYRTLAEAAAREARPTGARSVEGVPHPAPEKGRA